MSAVFWVEREHQAFRASLVGTGKQVQPSSIQPTWALGTPAVLRR